MLLSAAFQDGEVCRQIGSAWRLYLHLVLNEDGRMIGTLQHIASKMNAGQFAVRDWINTLAKAGILQKVSRGHSVQIELAGEHLEIARAPEAVTIIEERPAVTDPRLDPCIAAIKAAEKNGQKISISFSYNP